MKNLISEMQSFHKLFHTQAQLRKKTNELEKGQQKSSKLKRKEKKGVGVRKEKRGAF